MQSYKDKEMKMADYILYGHKTYDYIRHESHAPGILDKIDEYRWIWLRYLQRANC